MLMYVCVLLVQAVSLVLGLWGHSIICRQTIMPAPTDYRMEWRSCLSFDPP
jgi:hypothetical protein